MLSHALFDSAAYRALKPGARALLLELIRRYNGSNNGKIGLGVREAAKALGVGKNAAQRYLQTLIEHGLALPSRRGGFNLKDPHGRRQTEWRLTWLAADSHRPAHEWKDFVVKSAVPKKGTVSPQNGDTNTDAERVASPKKGHNGSLGTPSSPQSRDTYISNQGVGGREEARSAKLRLALVGRRCFDESAHQRAPRNCSQY